MQQLAMFQDSPISSPVTALPVNFEQNTLPLIVDRLNGERNWGRRNTDESFGLSIDALVGKFHGASGYQALAHIYHGAHNMAACSFGFQRMLPDGMYDLMNASEILALLYSVGRIKEDAALFDHYSEMVLTRPLYETVSKLVSYAMGGEHGSIFRGMNDKAKRNGVPVEFASQSGWLQQRMMYLSWVRPAAAIEFMNAFMEPYIPSHKEYMDNCQWLEGHWARETYPDPNIDARSTDISKSARQIYLGYIVGRAARDYKGRVREALPGLSM